MSGGEAVSILRHVAAAADAASKEVRKLAECASRMRDDGERSGNIDAALLFLTCGDAMRAIGAVMYAASEPALTEDDKWPRLAECDDARRFIRALRSSITSYTEALDEACRNAHGDLRRGGMVQADPHGLMSLAYISHAAAAVAEWCGMTSRSVARCINKLTTSDGAV